MIFYSAFYNEYENIKMYFEYWNALYISEDRTGFQKILRDPMEFLGFLRNLKFEIS